MSWAQPDDTKLKSEQTGNPTSENSLMHMNEVCSLAWYAMVPCKVWGPRVDFSKTSSLHGFDGKSRKSTWRAGINEGCGNHHKKAPGEAWELREAPVPGVWIRPCSFTPATTSNIMTRPVIWEHRRHARRPGITKPNKTTFISASSGSQRTRQRYHT